MHKEMYPSGTVEKLLQTDEVRQPTKAVLQERLQPATRPAKQLFDEETFIVLQAVCDCLFPQERSDKIPLAEMLETTLITKPGVGWRYNDLPPINTTLVNGLIAVSEEARHRFGQPFPQLAAAQKDELLKAVQQGNVHANGWKTVPASSFFTELLVRLAEAYYSHPFAKDEIGDVSFADAHGWQHLGLNNIEPREPKPQTSSSND